MWDGEATAGLPTSWIVCSVSMSILENRARTISTGSLAAEVREERNLQKLRVIASQVYMRKQTRRGWYSSTTSGGHAESPRHRPIPLVAPRARRLAIRGRRVCATGAARTAANDGAQVTVHGMLLLLRGTEHGEGCVERWGRHSDGLAGWLVGKRSGWIGECM